MMRRSQVRAQNVGRMLLPAACLILAGLAPVRAQPAPGVKQVPPHDAVLLVGGRPDGISLPSLEMVLRARKACQLMLEDKAGYLVISGNQTSDKRVLQVIRGHKGKRTEPRISAAEMLAVIAFSRGIGRMAIRLAIEPAAVVEKCRAHDIRKVLCIGDGKGPEKPAVEALAAAGVGVEYVSPYATIEEGKQALAKDGTLTDEEKARPVFKDFMAALKAENVEPSAVEVTFNIGTDGVDMLQAGVMACKLIKSGIGRYLFVAGGGSGYICPGERAQIVAVGYGIPPERVVYHADMGSSACPRNCNLWAASQGFKHVVHVGVRGDSGHQIRDGIHWWGFGFPRVHEGKSFVFEAEIPRDKNAKVASIVAEIKAMIAQWEPIARQGPAEKRQEASDRIKVYKDQLKFAETRMLHGFSCGRSSSFPSVPWDFDGITPCSNFSDGTVTPENMAKIEKTRDSRISIRGVVGANKKGADKSGVSLDVWLRHIIHDFGSRGPWRDLMDARIKVVPDRFEKYPPQD